MSPRFFLAEALRSIRANAAVSVAATVTVLIAVFVLGVFVPSYLYVQSAVDSQKDKLDINVFIADSATVPQVDGVRAQLAALQDQGSVKAFTYVNKDDALVELRGRLRDPSILDELPSNPLPAKFNVKPADPENAQAIIDSVKDSPAIDPELGVDYGKDTADKFLTAAKYIQWVSLGLIVILLIAAVLLIGNTIRLSIFARRREVEVMKLVGATNWFIRWPFVIEGIICGLIGAVFAVMLLFGVKVGLVDRVLDDADSALSKDRQNSIGFPMLGLMLVAAGALVGALGSGITLRRFLKV